MSKRILSLLIPITFAAACAASPSTAPADVNPAIASATGSGNGGTTAAAGTIIEVPLAPEAGSAFPRAHGEAKWKFRDASRRELEIELEDMVAGTRLNFFVGGTQYGTTQTVDSLGAARIELSSQLGQQVPQSVSGQRVEVRTEDGAVVIAGSF